MLVFAEGAAEPVPSSDTEALDLLGIGHRVGERVQRCGGSEGLRPLPPGQAGVASPERPRGVPREPVAGAYARLTFDRPSMYPPCTSYAPGDARRGKVTEHAAPAVRLVVSGA